MKKLFVLFTLGMAILLTGCSQKNDTVDIDEIVDDYVKVKYDETYHGSVKDIYYIDGEKYVNYTISDDDYVIISICDTPVDYMIECVEV